MSSSSSSSSSEAKWLFDVFLSFRGEDVRRGFLADLHRCLLHRGINAYIDSEDLRPGDQISPALTKAIEESRMAVLVFSENYASSRWCLDELLKVMECKRLKGQLVLPVFYGVEPREVRGRRESFGEALARHKEKLGKDSERVEKWRQALIEAGNLSGWHYDHGDDTKFIESIVKEISTILARVPLSVAKHPVGLGCRVEKVMPLLSIGSDDVRMIGIWGTGGVGKTTIAKDVYNSIASQFDGCSFLANVRETSSRPDGLVHLQKTLLSQILWKENLEVLSVDGGANLIRDILRCRKILLVLDDVDHGKQLNALARECEWFGKWSRIIVTTRDKHVLTSHGIDRVYEVRTLDQDEAFKLLSSYAFPGNQKNDISRHHINNILGYAKGLPLAIVVLGPFLCGRSKGEWESTLEKLAENPNKDINSVLKIGFDALEDNEKDIFLDIACFFKGRKMDYVTKVLDGCGLKTLIGIQALIERSLVTIGYGGIVQMHDLIQLMGQDTIKQESPNYPGRRSRLWCYDDVYEVLSAATGTNDVKGLVLQLRRPAELHISPGAFTHMRRLKLLILSNARISGGPVCLPDDLRWLEWYSCHSSTLKFSAGPKKLVCFDVRGSRIKKFGGNLKDFEKLKFINLNECWSLVYMPDVSCIPNLEELNLSRCRNLEHVHDSVANHCKLRKLNLVYCFKLQRFPNILNKNESLREVLLGWTSIEELPTSIGNLVSLEDISLLDCKKLVILPSSIYKLQNLKVLQLCGCSQLQEIPKIPGKLRRLKANNCKSLTRIPSNICDGGDFDLEELEVSNCQQLQEIPEIPRKLRRLKANNCKSLTRILSNICDVGDFDLEELKVSNCQQLQEIPKIPRKLRRLKANNCKSLIRIPSNICDVGDVELYSSRDRELVRNGFPVNDLFMPEKFHCQPNHRVVLPGGEMPKWLLPNKEGYISFVASKDLYEKIQGVAFCVVFQVEARLFRPNDGCEFEVIGSVNCKAAIHDRFFKFFDLDNVWLEYMELKDLWTVDHFGPNDLTHFCISIRVCNYHELLVKKCGFRLICKPLENDIEVLLQDDQLLDPALFYEVSHEDNPMSTKEKGLNMVDSSIERHRYSSLWCYYGKVSPGREMPKGFVLVEDDSISFKASQDLYNNFVGFFLCVVFDVEDGENEVSFDIVPRVNGQKRNEVSGTLGSFDTDHVWFQFFRTNALWGLLEGAVDFGQFEESYPIFSLNIRVVGATVKKLGYVLQSNPLEDALKVEIEKNCLMDLASLFENREDPEYAWRRWQMEGFVTDLSLLEDSNVFPITDLFMPEVFHCQPNHRVVLPGGEMPKWLLPNKEGYISFMASKDLYEKILGVVFCVVFQVLYRSREGTAFEVIGSVNCKAAIHRRHLKFFDLDNVWLEYMELKDLWTVDNFGPNDRTHFRISIRVCNYHELLVKKCGFRLICKPLENDSKVLLQDDQLLDPALFYEVSHEDNPMSTKEKGLNMFDSSIERHRYSSLWCYYGKVSPGREMPKGFVLVEDDSISFKASQDLYNNFVGFFLCVVFDVEDGENEVSFDIVPRVNGQKRNEVSGTLGSFDTDHVWFQFFRTNALWGLLEGAVDFGQFEESYPIFSLNIRVVGATVKKLGYVLQSNPLEDALKVEIEKNCLMDPASLFEDREDPQFAWSIRNGWSRWKDWCKRLEDMHGGRDSIY